MSGRVDNGETSDTSARVLANSGRWRVIRCKDDLQFIVQRRQAGSAKFPWRAVAYVLNESALPAVLARFPLPKEDFSAITRALVAPGVRA